MNCKNCKMLVIDLDGTAIDSNYIISSNMINLIKELRENNVYVLIATGRSVSDSYRYYKLLDLDTELVTYNGGFVWNPKDDSEVIYREINDGRKILTELYDAFPIENIVISSCKNTYYLNNKNSFLVNMMFDDLLPSKTLSFEKLLDVSIMHRIILSVSNSYLNQILQYIKDKKYNVSIFPWKHRDDIIDISIANIGKWEAVKQIADKLGIPYKNIISIGDNVNDLELLKHSGIGIAMNNSTDEIKSIANFVTEFDNNEDGAFEFLKNNKTMFFDHK